MPRRIPLAVLEDGRIKGMAERGPDAVKRRQLVAIFDRLDPRARKALVRFAEVLDRERQGASPARSLDA